jgi:hypothetical protein
VFHNGDVKKVWSWWERNHPARLSTVPGPIVELMPNSNLAQVVSSHGDAKKSRSHECPRTLKDLNDMTTAAKAAQWGDHDDSDASSAGVPTPTYNLFEDDSSDSGNDQTDDFLSGKESSDMYSRYLGASQRPTTTPAILDPKCSDVVEDEKGDHSVPLQESVVVASSDTLSPVVKVLHRFDELALNRQSPALANGWRFGDVDSLDDSSLHDHAGALHLSGGVMSRVRVPRSHQCVSWFLYLASLCLALFHRISLIGPIVLHSRPNILASPEPFSKVSKCGNA